MKTRCLLSLLLCWVAVACAAPGTQHDPGKRSPLSLFNVSPVRLLWKSDAGVKNPQNLLAARPGQSVLKEPAPPCVLTASSNGPAGVLLDFGRELQGYVEIFTPMTAGKDPVRVRVRFGESASEAMAELGGKQNAQNDHALRDQIVTLPWLGKITVGPSGFRFVRIDALDPKRPAHLSEVRAVLQIRDIPYVGQFRCDDDRLNKIWDVGAYTVHLNMQDYLWDGIKRDRLVWIGDMHPEVSTINAVFGFNDVVPGSLDLTRDITPVTEWMNGISSYSMWWVLIHEDWWMHHGNKAYLDAQKPYLGPLLKKLAKLVGPDGRERIDGMRFLDWPSSPNKQGVTAGLQGLLVMTLESGARLMEVLGDSDLAKTCSEAAARGRKVVPEVNGSKSGAALLSLAGMVDAQRTAKSVLKVDGPKGVSTFYGFYVLQALAKSGDTDTALDFISTYWGAMLDFGATTFWEDFDLSWTNNAARIDELVPAGKKDIHGDCGAYCYEGFRHSFCHGWASGPTAWMSQNVLGVKPIEPGFRKVAIKPQLGRLKWAEGAYPTPHGPIRVRHDRQPDGSVKSKVEVPVGVEWFRDGVARN
jgi:alpha-L-rhamnosidase